MTLTEARAISGLSNRKAAKAIGVAGSTIDAWENHGRMPSPEVLERAAQVYGVEYAALRRAPVTKSIATAS